MPDICMCEDKECPNRKNCYRFVANPHIVQAYFLNSPRNGQECESYWPLKDIEIKNVIVKFKKGKET